VNVHHQIQIVAGRRCYGSQVTYSGTEEALSLVPGIVNMKSDSLYVLQLNDQYTALLTHDYQSEDGSILAMALMVPSTYLNRTGETSDEGEGIIQTYYACLDARPGESQHYRFYAFWEKENPLWGSVKEIETYLQTEAERLSQSIIYYNTIN
jgi:hypothetical protein